VNVCDRPEKFQTFGTCQFLQNNKKGHERNKLVSSLVAADFGIENMNT
jgi:hypothetical protein